jgi:hypothetical protein
MLATFWMTKTLYVRLLFKQEYRSYKESSCIMDESFIRAMSQVSRSCPWRSLACYKLVEADSCATVRMGLWRRSDALQCLEALASKTSELQGNTIRTIGQASPINFYTELDFNWHYLGSFCKTSGRHDNLSGRCPAFQNISGFLYKLGQAVWTWTCYQKNCAILERRS